MANSQIYENYRPYWLCDHKGRRLELDFYFPSRDMAIEVQGMQHYQFTPYFHRDYDEFIQLKERDYNKRQICMDLGIRLFEIHDQEELDMLWVEICQYLSVERGAAMNPKLKERKIKTLDEDKLKLHIHRLLLALEQDNLFFVRAVYVRAKSYFLPIFLGRFIRKCSQTTLQQFLDLSEKAREVISAQKKTLRIKAPHAHPRDRFRKELRLIERALSPKTGHKRNQYKAPRPYKRANRHLNLEQLPGGHFLVYGGSEPHLVIKTDAGYQCDCLPSRSTDCSCCSHRYRVEIEIELRKQEACNVACNDSQNWRLPQLRL